MERFDDSRTLFAQVENISPNYPNVYYKKAKANILENDFEEALKNYNQALNLLPEENMIEGNINLGAFRNYQSLIRKEINLIK
jgi:tetratricopeptide (TPR) repeat protein